MDPPRAPWFKAREFTQKIPQPAPGDSSARTNPLLNQDGQKQGSQAAGQSKAEFPDELASSHEPELLLAPRSLEPRLDDEEPELRLPEAERLLPPLLLLAERAEPERPALD
ncbi:MAG: hypothetical protein JWM32_2628 [Verrucomicrobia bacterium]|nr:hypothetical protein [Verrucomicrobiota bacterium]